MLHAYEKGAKLINKFMRDIVWQNVVKIFIHIYLENHREIHTHTEKIWSSQYYLDGKGKYILELKTNFS